jgi:hypothetical protein
MERGNGKSDEAKYSNLPPIKNSRKGKWKK